ncbi:hypothetical protein BX600DRAFT_184829 [Xylariales sp. PMI_506]|nr:hypothetical protein BX600DRAFT_184829 [Xylariales sp. PMI_506]
MQALRQRAACVARRSVRQARSYASDSHGHHAAPQVEEGLGTAFFVFAGAVPVSFFAYSITRPGSNGEPSSFTKFLHNFDYFKEESEVRNALRTQAMEQAAHDKHLFYYSGKNPHVDLKTPELINAGSPWNVPAGHRARGLEELTEHYRQQHLEEEERKVKKLEAKAASASS